MPFAIHNRIAECWDGKRRLRDLSRLDGVVVHRFTLYDGTKIENGADISRWQRTHVAESGTGGENAYHFAVARGGLVDQLLPLEEVGFHARAYNENYLGIVVIGDFRKEPPTSLQWASLVELCSLLLPLTRSQSLVAHDKVPGGSGDASKVCPGDFLNMGRLQAAVSARIKARSAGDLRSAGGLA